MKTRTTIHWLAGVAGGLLLALPGLAWADVPWGAGGIVGALEACEDELAECQEQPGMTFPGDGQTGAPLAYAEADPPDGTFIDLNTGLMWEMKLAADDPLCTAYEQVDRDVHCVQNRYTWTDDDDPHYLPTGTAFMEFLATLNSTLFADHDDWRLPTAKELQSLVDYSVYDPAVSDALPGATAPFYYWSSTADASRNDYAWYVYFGHGHVNYYDKGLKLRVRAVRGGW
jgi:hypothetical protein